MPKNSEEHYRTQVIMTSNNTENTEYHVSNIAFKGIHDFKNFWRLRREAFTAWYGHMQDDYPGCLRDKKNSRWAVVRFNAKSACFPELFRQIQDSSGSVAGYLQMTPAYWGGDADALNNLEYYDAWHDFSRMEILKIIFAYLVFYRRPGLKKYFDIMVKKIRENNLRNCNTIILTAMVIENNYRGQRIPSRLIASAKEQAKALGFKYVISPFRPSQYGKYKKENNIKHNDVVFAEYCYKKNEEGYPVDAWLRALTKNGMKMLKPVPNSFQCARSIECFELFKKAHKTDDWYQSGEDIWECGETQTWYIDRHQNIAVSIEPNLWGQILPSDN
jgi:GNAT superfamily N-acetyltransferase